MSVRRFHALALLLTLAILALASGASAVPSNPELLRTLAQPDGSQFQARLVGDERAHWYETADGFTIQRDVAGYWTYAERTANGSLRAASQVVGAGAPREVPHLRPDANLLASGVAERHVVSAPQPTVAAITGTQWAVIILIEFSDTVSEGSSGPHDAAYFENPATGLVLGANQGKLHDYLDEVSYGQLDLQGAVAGGIWYRSAHTEAYYGGDCNPGHSCVPDHGYKTGTDNCDVCVYELVREAVQLADSVGFDFAPYDADANGVVDHVMIVHAGENQASSAGAPDDIWSHQGTIPAAGEPVDGVFVRQYTMLSEWDAMSAFAHEFCHDLGAPDLYDYDLDSDPVGRWCNMGFNYESERPPHLCGLLKVDIDANFANGKTGWVAAQPLRTDSTYTVRRLDQNQTGSILMTDPVFSGAEYFLVENRQKAGYYDSSLPESGLLFTHLDMAMPDGGGRFNDGPPSNTYHGAWVERFLNIASANGAAYSADDLETLFSPVTVPDTDANGNIGIGQKFYNIGAEADVMTFAFRAGPTAVSGPTGGNTRWTVDGSPYVVEGNITVSDGDTLTIEPGVIVKFNYGLRLTVEGALIATGAAGDTIIFTSSADDVYGGDTNRDGPSSGSPGQWQELIFSNADAGCNLSYCRIRYAGQYAYQYERYENAIHLTGSGTSLTMSHSIVEYTYGDTHYYSYGPYAIWGQGGTSLQISQCEIRNNQMDGIYAEGALDLRNTLVRDHGRNGVRAGTNGAIARDNRIVRNNGWGLYLDGSSCTVVGDTLSSNAGLGLYCPQLPAAFSDNVSTDNGDWGFYIPAQIVDQIWNANCINSANARGNAIGVSGGSIPSTTTWVDEQPYAIWGGSVTVPDSVTLTLEPGVIMKFAGGTSFLIDGTLYAVGAQGDSIIFTSYADDVYGGDTNRDGPSSGSPGQWQELIFSNADAGCNLSYCRIRYAGQYHGDYYNRYENAIHLTGSGTSLTMSHSIVEYTYGDTNQYSYGPYAIWGRGGTSLQISHCEIRNNQMDGIYAEGALDLRNTVVRDHGRNGVRAGTNGAIARDNRIVRNNGWGLYLDGSSCAVVGDTLSSNAGLGLYCPQLPAAFSDNVSTDNGDWGFYIPAQIVDRIWNANCINSANARGNAIGVSGGSIPSTTTWVDEQPYAIWGGGVTVPDGVTLTLEPGVIMKFAGGTSFLINGTLYAVGAQADSTILTSYADDVYGGDTNRDGPSVGSPGQWQGLIFANADAGCNLSYCRIRYAGQYHGDYYNRYKNAIHLTGSGTSLTMSHSIVEYTYGDTDQYSTGPYAIWGQGGTSLQVSHCEIRNNMQLGLLSDGSLLMDGCRVSGNSGYYGVFATGSGVRVSNSIFEGNGHVGLRLTGSSCHVVADTLRDNGTHGMYLDQVPLEFANCYAAGNHSCGFVLPTQIVENAWIGNNVRTGDAVGVLGGSVPTTTTWIDEHPYAIYGDITIPHDVTLNLEAGAILKFAQYFKLTVNGRLIANGTETDWIVFTSYRDDAYGGDTNADGPGAASRGDWLYLIFDGTNPGSTMKYCRVRYAGYNHGANEAIIVNGSGAELAMLDCIVEETGAGSAAPYAVCAYGGSSFQMIDTQILNNGGHGAFIAEPAALVRGCLARGNGLFGFYAHPNLVGEIATLDSLHANGWNNSLGVQGGVISEDDAWPNKYVYAMTGAITIDPGATLILNKGTVIKVNGNCSLDVHGGLVAQGDAVDKVIFTSFKDDNYGGDTNLDGVNSIPQPGDWGQVHLDGAPVGVLQWVIISFGGAENIAALKLDGCTMNFSECIVHDNLGCGVRVGTDAGLTFTNCDLYRNGYGLENLNSSAYVDARGCWWGDPSGPSGVGPGTGDAVSTYVYYEPWLDHSIDNPWVALASPSITGNYTDVLIYDLDRDPLLDLIAATEGQGLEVYHRVGFATWEAAASPVTEGQFLSLAKGDFDNDGRDDHLLVGGPTGVRCFESDAVGHWVEQSNGLVQLSVNDVRFAYINHDAYPDVVACSGNNGGIWVMYGDGLGNWVAGDRPATTGTYNRIAAADLDNDTWLDLVATNGEYLGVHIWYGDADSSWTATDPIGTGSAFYGLDLGDIDRNGTFDIAAGSAQATVGISMYLNDGARHWTSRPGPTTTGRYGDIVLRNLNGDQWVDLVAANLFGGINVWIGTSGGYWNYWYHPTNVNIYNGICVDDFTLNGSMDIAGAATIHGLALWENLTPGAQQEYFDTDPDNLAFGRVAIGNCAHETFQLTNVTAEDTLRNVVVYTTSPAFQVAEEGYSVGPFDMLPGEVRDFEVRFCPGEPVAENELVVIHSAQAVTHVRVTGEGVPYIEPVWAVALQVQNAVGGSGNSQTLRFGGGVGATDSLDVASGEVCLPPLPPSEVFDTRFLMLGCDGSLVNIHDIYAEYDTFYLQWQAGSGGYPVTVSWSPDSIPEGTFLISDTFGGAFVDTLDMAKVSQVVIPPEQSFVTELAITISKYSTFTHPLARGWQLISLPVQGHTDSLHALFPNAISAWSWRNSYEPVQELLPCSGYWLNMPQAENVRQAGLRVESCEKLLSAGWSLVGAIADTVAVSQVVQVPPNSITSVFGFNGAYFQATQLVPGKGYWFNVSQPCTITLAGGPLLQAQPDSKPDVASKLPAETAHSTTAGWRLPLGIHNGGGSPENTRTLVFGQEDGATDAVDLMLGEQELPPWQPSEVFEARFDVTETNGVALDLRGLTERTNEWLVTWQPGRAGYPIVLSWNPAAIPSGVTLTLTDNLDGSLIRPVDMRAKNELIVGPDLASVTGFMIRAEIAADPVAGRQVTQFRLGRSMPNPTQDATTIEFDVPRPSNIDLSIFDVGGRLVRALVRGERTAGSHRIMWDCRDEEGREVSSGIYFYRLQAPGYVKTRSLLVVH